MDAGERFKRLYANAVVRVCELEATVEEREAEIAALRADAERERAGGDVASDNTGA